MKQLVLLLAFVLLILPSFLLAQSISGKVRYDKSTKGTLFVFIRYLSEKGNQPVALKRYPNPKFPLSFKLTPEDAMVPGTPFKGPFRVIAKLTPEGRIWSDHVTFAKGESDEKKPVNVGDENIVIDLK